MPSALSSARASSGVGCPWVSHMAQILGISVLLSHMHTEGDRSSGSLVVIEAHINAAGQSEAPCHVINMVQGATYGCIFNLTSNVRKYSNILGSP